jgi:hypothetical protein
MFITRLRIIWRIIKNKESDNFMKAVPSMAFFIINDTTLLYLDKEVCFFTIFAT